MKLFSSLRPTMLLMALAVLMTPGLGTVAHAADASCPKPPKISTNPDKLTQNDASVIKAGDSQIDVRLCVLNTLSQNVSSLQRISDSNKNVLLTQESQAKTGLTQLRAKLDAEKTLAAAKTDYSNIFLGYRVYMVVLPKVKVVKVADDQQVRANALVAGTGLLQLVAHGSPNAAADEAKLDDVLGKAKQAVQVAQTAENTVYAIQPSDYNSNHKVMTDYFTKLTANKALLLSAYSEAQAVVKSLKADGTLKSSQQSYLDFPQWGVKMPVSGALKTASYQDITTAYSFPYSTVEVRVTGQPEAATCKGGVVGWMQRLPDTIDTDGSRSHAHIGMYNYVSSGVQDCGIGGSEPTLAKQFDQAVTKMVAD